MAGRRTRKRLRARGPVRRLSSNVKDVDPKTVAPPEDPFRRGFELSVGQLGWKRASPSSRGGRARKKHAHGKTSEVTAVFHRTRAARLRDRPRARTPEPKTKDDFGIEPEPAGARGMAEYPEKKK